MRNRRHGRKSYKGEGDLLRIPLLLPPFMIQLFVRLVSALNELRRTGPPRPNAESRQRTLRAAPCPNKRRTATLNRLIHHLRIPPPEPLPQLAVVIIEQRPPEVGQLAEESEVLDVRRNDDREVPRRVPMLARLASRTLRNEVLDSVDRALVFDQVGLAPVRLVEEAAFARLRAGRDVYGDERRAVAEQVGNDIARGFVDVRSEMQVPTMLEESGVVARVEVRRRVLGRRVLRAVQRVVDAEDVVFWVRVSTGRAGSRDGRVVLRLVDQARFGGCVAVEAREESVRLCGSSLVSTEASSRKSSRNSPFKSSP